MLLEQLRLPDLPENPDAPQVIFTMELVIRMFGLGKFFWVLKNLLFIFFLVEPKMYRPSQT